MGDSIKNNTYLQDIERRKISPMNVLEKIDGDKIPHDIYSRILCNWNLASMSNDCYIRTPYDLNFLDDGINKKISHYLSDFEIVAGRKQFECEFIAAYKITMTVAGYLHLKKRYCKRIIRV